jgi:radical SAM superfamily enzyme YgiQ (UPF0313 family)
MKIKFINPPQPYLITPKTQVPLGLLYLSSVIKRDRPNVDVELLDFSADSIDDAALKIGEADVYGFTATSLDYQTQTELMRKIRERFPRATYIVGGPHASVMFEDVLCDGYDSVFIGETEDTILQFIDDWETMQVRSVYRPEKKVDLDTLPRPDRDAFPWIGGNVLTKGAKNSVNLMASRGCPYNCTFCASETIWNRNLRWRKVEDVVAEIKECIDEYGIKVYRFSDDNMASNRRWTEKFCELVKPLDITWRLSVRVDRIDPPLLKMMSEAGCRELGLGCESFDSDVLKTLNKKIRPEQSVRAIRWCHEAGIGARILMMISTPGETYKKTVQNNYEALDSVRGKFVYLSFKIFMPLPGTAIWNFPEKFGIKIVNKDFSKYNFYVYQRDEKGDKVFSTWTPIEFDNMTPDQQMENIRSMFKLAETFPENATGEL